MLVPALMLFHEASIELKIAVAIAGLVPIALVYAVIALSGVREVSFGTAIGVTIAYFISYLLVSIVFSDETALRRGYINLGEMLRRSAAITAFSLPALLVTILACLFTIMSWRAEVARYAFVCFSVLAQILYLINVALFTFGIELIYF